MNWPDIINSGFALGGGVAMTLNCVKLFHDKSVRGTSILSGCFFLTWASWNVFFFTHLHQWVSVCTTVVEVGSMATWVAMAVYYTRKESRAAVDIARAEALTRLRQAFKDGRARAELENAWKHDQH